MPVYARGYRPWQRSTARARPAWWTIARRGIVEPLRSRRMLFLLVVAWVPAIVKGGILYFTYKMGELSRLVGGQWTDVGPRGFLSFLQWQSAFVLILLAIVGSGLISRDRREGGLALYLARPLGVKDYVAGKGSVVMFYYFAVTLFPVWALCLFGYLVTSGATGAEMLLAIPLRAAAHCAATGAAFTLMLLALSSVGQRTVFVALWWVLLYAGTDALARIMSLFDARLMVLDVPRQFLNVGVLFFGGSRVCAAVPPWLSLLVMLGWAAAGVWTLHRRVRPVEVVA